MKGKNYAKVASNCCVACGECIFCCPRGAITVEHGCYGRVDLEKCVGCGICARNCPVSCITICEREVQAG
jgi:ferredoxin